MDWHVMAGLGVAALLVLRMFLGFFGAETSRFSQFVKGPRAILEYVRGRSGEAVGHSPIGGWSVTALLGLLVAETALGLFSTDEDGLDSGPLSSWLNYDQTRFASYLHGLTFQALVALIGLHIAAVFFYLARGRNLVMPMLTGVKLLPQELREPRFASPLVVVTGIILALASFIALWRLNDP